MASKVTKLKRKSDYEIKIEACRAAGAKMLTPEEEAALDPDVFAVSRRKSEAMLAQMSMPGTLGLSEHLERARWRHQIVDDHFKWQATFDKVHVFQFTTQEDETYGDTGIHIPGTAKARIANESPQGILTSAGIQALDSLRGAGIQLGDLVEFMRGVVSQRVVGVVGGRDQWSMRIYVGDISGAAETAERLRAGQLKLSYDKASGKHCYEMNGEAMSAVEPFQRIEV